MNVFIPGKAGKGILYPIDGGMIMGVKANTTATDAVFMTFSGIKNIQNVLKDLDKYRKSEIMFLELLACEGGCVNGPGIESITLQPLSDWMLSNELPEKKLFKLKLNFL